jgi:uncharacterized membrane protein YagU involved in acid resistance
VASTITNRSTATNFAIQIGIVGGIIGSLAMAMYAMVVSDWVKHSGFFTPLYHIAASIISPSAMMKSMGAAMHSSNYYFAAGPAIVGAIVHMMTGAIAGIVFVLIARSTSIKGFSAVITGAIFGLLVMVVNGLVVLPIVSHLFGGGKPISDMAKIVGWGHFTIEHLIFGMMLGLIYALATSRKSTRSR